MYWWYPNGAVEAVSGTAVCSPTGCIRVFTGVVVVHPTRITDRLKTPAKKIPADRGCVDIDYVKIN
jgi:hypothetical protein